MLQAQDTLTRANDIEALQQQWQNARETPFMMKL